MQFTTFAIAAFVSLVGAQGLPSLPASVLTAIPTEVIQGFISDPTSVIADIASSVSAGNPPEWYANLPEDVQQSLQAIAGTPPTGAPTGTDASVPATTDASASDIISSVIESVSQSVSASVSESNASASSSISASQSSESESANASETDASATASSTDAATVPTAGVLGMGVAAFAGLVGVIAL